MLKKYDKALAIVFGLLTIGFIVLAFTNEAFLNWAFERHHNQLSWYVRPIFLIPFCYFAFKRSHTGIMFTVFCLFTSMFWFPKPEVVSDQVREFLQFEVEYLTSTWNITKIAISLLIPISFIALAVAFWKRNLWIGLSVVVFMAIAKMIWSVMFGGQSGTSIMVPAIVGLFICIGLIYWGFRKLEKKNSHINM